MPLRIAVDLRMAQQTGVGRYLRCLLPELVRQHPEAQWTGVMNPGQPDRWLPEGLRPRVLPGQVPVYSVGEYLGLGRTFASGGFDLLHVPHFNVPRSVPVPMVVTIHDLIYLEFPEGARSPLHGWMARRRIQRAADRAAQILTVSEHAKGQIVRRLGVPAERVTAVLHGHEHARVEPSARRPEGIPEGPFLLYVGNHLPHKNLPFLLGVFCELRPERPDLSLVVAGPKSRHTAAVEEEVRRLGLGRSVLLADGLDDAALSWLYRNAAALVHPSKAEGFGFPVLEAMALGLPVVSSDAASLPEVAGDAAVLLPPDDAAGWRAALSDLLRERPEQRAERARRGRERASRFTWAEAARKTWEVYRRAATLGAR